MKTRLKPALLPGIIYSADNGQLICAKCAGQSALDTGRDRSGQKVQPLTQRDADDWKRVMDADLTCEGGCTVIRPSAGVQYDEAAAQAMFGSDAFLNAR